MRWLGQSSSTAKANFATELSKTNATALDVLPLLAGCLATLITYPTENELTGEHDGLSDCKEAQYFRVAIDAAHFDCFGTKAESWHPFSFLRPLGRIARASQL